MITIKEIAKLANVSPTTVSLVLNDKGGVSDEMRQQVKRILEDNGYVAVASRDRAREKIKNIRILKFKHHGWIVDGNEGFIQAIIDSIEQDNKREGTNLSISVNSGNLEAALKDILYDRTDGLILLGTEISPDEYHLIQSILCPYVVVDNIMVSELCDSITIDNGPAVGAALGYLKQLGYRNVGYFRSSVHIANFDERSEAFFRYCGELGINVEQRWVFDLHPTLNGAHESMAACLAAGASLPPAVFADNDTIAMGAMKAMSEYDISMPARVALIGFDDIPFSIMANPPLTTMRVPRSDIGLIAMNILRRRMLHPNASPIKVRVCPSLVVRGSTPSPLE